MLSAPKACAAAPPRCCCQMRPCSAVAARRAPCSSRPAPRQAEASWTSCCRARRCCSAASFCCRSTATLLRCTAGFCNRDMGPTQQGSLHSTCVVCPRQSRCTCEMAGRAAYAAFGTACASLERVCRSGNGGVHRPTSAGRTWLLRGYSGSCAVRISCPAGLKMQAAVVQTGRRQRWARVPVSPHRSDVGREQDTTYMCARVRVQWAVLTFVMYAGKNWGACQRCFGLSTRVMMVTAGAASQRGQESQAWSVCLCQARWQAPSRARTASWCRCQSR